MFCNKCGNQIEDNAAFCPNCGSKIEQTIQQPIEPKKEVKKSKPMSIKTKLKLILALILIIVIGGAVMIATSPSQKIVSSLKSGDYTKAQNTYSSNFEYGDSSLILDIQLGNIIDNTLAKYKENKIEYDKAFNVLDTIRAMGITKFMDKVDKAIVEIDDISVLLDAKKLCDEGNYAKAIELYGNISETSPVYNDAVKAMNAAKDGFKQNAVTELDKFIKENDFDKATNIIFSAEKSGMEDLKTSLMDKYIEGANTYVNSLLESNKYEDAKEFVSNINNIFPDEDKIKSIEDGIEKKYESAIIKKADTEIQNKKYENALSLMETAVNTLPGNAQFKSKYNECKLYLPSFINELDYLNKDGDINDNYSNLSDNTGKSYKRIYSVGYGNAFAEYLINGSYTNFIGTAGVCYDERSTTYSNFFEVYGDGVLLYTSPTFTGSSMPKDFDINITGVKILKIYYPKSNGDNSIASIFDGKLYNKNHVNNTSSTETTQALNKQ